MPDISTISFPEDTLLLNKYKVLSNLGSGHFGQVYHVKNVVVGHDAALKIVTVDNPIQHKAYIEAQAQNLCSHDHVVKIYTADILDGAVTIEMEYISGGSLEALLKNKFIPVIDSITYVKQILFALEFAHNKGIIHRDVKPANIMLSNNIAKLSDFGTIIQPSTGIKVTDLFYGPHASPEAINNGFFGPQSDVYGAGMTLLRAANNIADISRFMPPSSGIDHVKNGTLPGAIGFEKYLPRSLKMIINKSLHSNPSKRYPNAKSFRQALERLRPDRRWILQSDQNWLSTKNNEPDERIYYLGGAQNTVEYTKNGRRVRDKCKNFKNELDARAYMLKLVADSTLI